MIDVGAVMKPRVFNKNGRWRCNSLSLSVTKTTLYSFTRSTGGWLTVDPLQSVRETRTFFLKFFSQSKGTEYILLLDVENEVKILILFIKILENNFLETKLYILLLFRALVY